jgi:hypothetical protein
MKVLFINDSTSNPNWGDRASTSLPLPFLVAELLGSLYLYAREPDPLLAGNTLAARP